MTDLGKTLILVGLIAVVAGVLLLLFGKIPGMGKLPGDVVVRRENFTFYFPMATSLLISIILSLIMVWINKR